MGVGRRIGVLASHGVRQGALVPPWIYRAVAYEADDPFRQPVWTCSHNHTNVHEAQLCGSDWARSEFGGNSGQEAQISYT